jgi:hypothetical protein
MYEDQPIELEEIFEIKKQGVGNFEKFQGSGV